jgi:hypothetical protein
MSKMKYAFAMLAAGGAVGAASHAAATTVTFTGYTDDALTQPINLFSSGPAQYYYGYDPTADKTNFSVGAHALIGAVDPTPGQDSSGDTFSTNSVKTAFLEPSINPLDPGPLTLLPVNTVDEYIHLEFSNDGTIYAGEAHIDPSATLVDLTYDAIGSGTITGLPEPETWALMIGGLGLAGVALRSRRRQAALSA